MMESVCNLEEYSQFVVHGWIRSHPPQAHNTVFASWQLISAIVRSQQFIAVAQRHLQYNAEYMYHI